MSIFDVKSCPLFRSLSFLLFYLCTLAGYSQVSPQYIFHHLGLRDGLLSDEINATAQDAKGFIWIAGKNGLQRYDGYRFVDFRHRDNDSSSLPHNNISQVIIDKKNRLWLLTADDQLGYFDVNKFLFHRVPVIFNHTLLEKAAGELKLDQQRNIKFLLHDYTHAAFGVMAFDEATSAFSSPDTRFNVPNDWLVEFFSVDPVKGNFWLGTAKGLMKYDPRTGHYNYRGNNPDNDPVIDALQEYTMIQNPLMDLQGNFWMTVTNDERKSAHLLKYSSKDHKVYDYYDEIRSRLNNSYYKINSIIQSGNGPVWITGRGIFIRATEKLDLIFTDLPGQFSIHYDEIRQLLADRENNLWFSTNNGLYHMNPSASLFNYIGSKKHGADSIYTDYVVDFVNLSNGHILAASWGNGLFEFDKNFNTVESVIADQGDQKGERSVWALHRCSNGDIWAPHQDGYLYIFHAATHTTDKLHDPIFENKTIRQIAEDREGNIWLSTQGLAIIKWRRATNTYQLMRRTNAPVFRLYADRKGDIWALADKAMKLNIEDGSIMAEFKSGAADGKHLLEGEISDIIQFSDTSYIIASMGLNIINTRTGRITYYTTANGLPSDYISNIITDKQGVLWVTTDNGICSIDFKNRKHSVYGIEDGILNNGFTPCSSTLLNDGRIVIGTNHSIFTFDPGKINQINLPQVKVEITGISVLNKDLPLDSLLQLDRIQLNYDENSMVIKFSTLNYKTKHVLAYKVEGLDKTWINATGRNDAIYSYLPPGDYTFRVGIPDDSGVTRSITSLPFSIRAPFWKSWMFYCLLAALAAVIIWWINKQRIKRISDILQMRSNIGKELHKEVSTTLKNISVLSEIAAMKADVNLEQSKDYIQEIKLKSRRTVIAMDDVMWSIDPANDSMVKIVERIHEIADILHHEYDTHFEIDIDSNVKLYRFTMKERLEFMLIYKRAILMFSRDIRAPRVLFSLKKDHQNLLMTMIAEGGSLSGVEKKISRGIEEIKSRADSIGCVINIQQTETDSLITALMKH